MATEKGEETKRMVQQLCLAVSVQVQCWKQMCQFKGLLVERGGSLGDWGGKLIRLSVFGGLGTTKATNCSVSRNPLRDRA